MTTMSSLTSSNTKKKPIKTVHQKTKLFRTEEPLLAVFMWGVSHSINELSHINAKVMLMPDDFKAHSKIRVDNHLYNKENFPSHFKFKEYCPAVFHNLRDRFEVAEDHYMNSLTKAAPYYVGSPGRSGARFLNSYDRMYVIKIIASEDVAEMHRILKDYHMHIVEQHAKSKLPQYLGMYRLTVNDNETYMIIMKNIFSPRLTVHKKYDLKGSTVSRQASMKEKAKELPTYKDNDFVNDGTEIKIGEESRKEFLSVLEYDVEFLRSQDLMDYSLLVGIHDVEKGEIEATEKLRVLAEHLNSTESDENGEDSGDDEALSPPESPMFDTFSPAFDGEIDNKYEPFAILSDEGNPRKEIYFLALIDILTHYGMKKRTAKAAKTVKHGSGAEISTVKPEQYAKRFLDFVSKVII